MFLKLIVALDPFVNIPSVVFEMLKGGYPRIPNDVSKYNASVWNRVVGILAAVAAKRRTQTRKNEMLDMYFGYGYKLDPKEIQDIMNLGAKLTYRHLRKFATDVQYQNKSTVDRIASMFQQHGVMLTRATAMKHLHHEYQINVLKRVGLFRNNNQ